MYGSEKPTEAAGKLQFAGVEESCMPSIYTCYTLIYRLKGVQEAKIKIWVDRSPDTLLKRSFQLSKVEKQDDIHPAYTDIQKCYTLNRCKKKYEWQINVQGRQFQIKYRNRQ